MMDSVVVDTDVISYWFKGDTRAKLYRRHLLGKAPVVSFMTVAELDEWVIQHQWSEKRREELTRHLQQCLFYPADRELCRYWADVRESCRRVGRTINPADAWIAATAVALRIPLVTHNALDYQGVAGLTIITEAA